MERLKFFFKNHYYLLTAPLMFLSFPSFDIRIFKGFPFFAWIYLIPLFIYVRGKVPGRVYVSAFLTGLLGHFLTYEWVGNFAGDQPGGYPVIVGFLIPALSVFFSLKIFMAEMISKRLPKLRFIVYPLIWCFIDYIQSIGFLAFPWTNIGYSQYTASSFLQLASVVGVTGINFIMIMVSYSVSEILFLRKTEGFSFSELLRQNALRRTAVFILLLLAVNIWGAVTLKSNSGPLKRDMRVSLVQSCIDPWEDWNWNRFRYLEDLEGFTSESLDRSPDLVIWSESATLETISYSYENHRLNSFQEALLGFVKEKAVPLFTGEIGVAEVKSGFFIERYPRNNAVLINKFGEPVKTYSKINLVPFGEWFPYEYLPLVGRPIKELANSFGGSNFVPGDEPELFEFNGRSFGPLICYEGIFYRLCSTYKRMGAEFLVNITNDGWTHTYRGHMQHFSAAVFRAVENGLWVVRVGNTGYTAVIDPYGRITSSMPILTRGYVTGDMDFSRNHSTFYSRYGFHMQIFLLILTAILFTWYAVTVFHTRSAIHNH